MPCSFGHLHAFDVLVTGVNGQVLYTLTAGDPRGQFSIDPRSGVVHTAKPLDRESQAYYNLAVTATDLASQQDARLSSTAMVRTPFSI